MRRILPLILLLLAAGCAPAASQEGEAFSLYFQEADLTAVPGGDALRAETVYLETEGRRTEQVASQLVLALLEGPSDSTLKNPIPAGTVLLSLEVEDLRANVDLSAPYRSLSGVGLTLADYAITLTLTQLPEISAVSITVRGQELAYRETQTFTAQEVLLSSNEDVVSTLPVTLYFLNETGALAAEERMLDLYEGDTQVDAVLRALTAGPEDRTLLQALPEGFQVWSVWLEEDVCYVNLSALALPELKDRAALEMGLEALVRSLCSLESVSEVQFLVDGEFTGIYGEVPLAQRYTG